ncbi:ribonuclease III [Fuerstiella marisgermanici]|uniref:Ribonuclease 3 n=1 Tax=Fuerstiella marisgermanici TaxID=1891926 RepID=A0A1P8WEJ3_9PLAN|nr:ribonuclease III [Fuerstiella marisgermanici]APZ92460.1 Ribonuclease 3 [Fuerstiella marisgermanici]
MDENQREDIFRRCEEAIGYQFKDRDVLRRGLTHSSCATSRLDCNERMEFLGDAVLGLVVCEFLYLKYPDRREGQLTQQKSHLVSRTVCTQVGNRLGLKDLILVGKGLQTIPDSLIAAGVESLVAAIYLDGGFAAAVDFIMRVFEEELQNTDEADQENYKSILQEETQRDGSDPPSYVVIEHRGPDHAREFCVAVEIAETQFESAWGRSKKEAEQKAAMHALEGISLDGGSTTTTASKPDSQGNTDVPESNSDSSNPPTNQSTTSTQANVPTTECRVLFQPPTDELRFLPEGPYSLPNGNISWVGIQHGSNSTVGSLNILDPASGTNQSFNLPGRPGFAFPTTKQNVFVCGVERSLGLYDVSDGSWTEILSGIDSDVDNTIINDGVVFDDNLIFGCKELEFKTKKAGLYLWRGRDKKLFQLRNDQICSNGKAVIRNPDQTLTLVDIDSPSKTITKCWLEVAVGTVGKPEVIVDLSSEDVFPDGMIVTPDGKSLIVALYDPGDPAYGMARQYGIESGELEAVWTCPGSPRVTCPQLVKVDGRVHLLLTTAVEHMDAEQQSRHPNAGSLFLGEALLGALGEQPLFPVG